MEQERFMHFINLIDGIHKSVQKIRIENAATFGIKSVHVFWISDLNSHPEGLTAAELASNGKISRSLVSRELSDLHKKGYILIAQGGGSKRGNYNSRIFLTEKGVQLARTIQSIEQKIQKEVRSGISDEELVMFYRTLEKFNINLKNISEDI